MAFSAVTYALTRGIAESATSGVSGYEVDGQTLKINLKDGEELEMQFPNPNGIKNMYIDANDHLIVVLDDNSIRDCGEIPIGSTTKATINKKVVDVLPTEDISEDTIYCVPCENAEGDDEYDEYMFMNNKWERFGTRDSAVEAIDHSKASIEDVINIFK